MMGGELVRWNKEMQGCCRCDFICYRVYLFFIIGRYVQFFNSLSDYLQISH